MQIGSMNNQSFGAILTKNTNDIIQAAAAAGMPKTRVKTIKTALMRLKNDNFDIAFVNPSSGTHRGLVIISDRKGHAVGTEIKCTNDPIGNLFAFLSGAKKLRKKTFPEAASVSWYA